MAEGPSDVTPKNEFEQERLTFKWLCWKLFKEGKILLVNW